MMTVECAISLAIKRCRKLYDLIEANEHNWQCMDARNRNEVGAWRRFLFDAGMAKDALPETPFLDPDHLQAYGKRQENYRAQREAKNGTQNN